MFFLLSKLLWLVAAPTNAFVACLVVGVLLMRGGKERSGRRLIAFATLALFVVGIFPVGTWLLRPLEDRFPQPAATALPPAGVVVLGGSTNELVSAARGQPTIVTAATRITAAVALARRYPGMRLVFSGGSGALLLKTTTEAAVTGRLWEELGIAPERITLEPRSRNTYENALFTRRLIEPAPGERWLLITSAFHMARAVGLFRAVGFPIVPCPVDYQTAGTAFDALPAGDIPRNLQRFDLAVREWIGLVIYRVSGRTHELFPAPD